MTPSRLAVLILGAALLLGLLAIAALAWASRPIPDILQLLTTSSLTGILGLLAPRPGLGTQGGQEDFR